MKNLLRTITAVVITLAAINLGLVGLFNMNLIHTAFANMPMVERYVHIAIGISGLIFAFFEFK